MPRRQADAKLFKHNLLGWRLFAFAKADGVAPIGIPCKVRERTA